jgi:hypothetical protein
VWWHIPVSSALGRLRQEYHKVKDTWGYTGRCCHKKREKKKKEFCDHE